MKNRGLYCLVLVCCICLAFTGGFFIGRNINHAPIQLSTVPSPSADASTPSDPSATSSQKIDINTATAAQLQTLPGIGATLAQRIVDYRQENGPFSGIADLINVPGIGEGRLKTILDYICVGG